MCRYHSRHADWRQTKKKEGVHVPSEFSHEVIGFKKHTVRASRPSNRFDRSASRGSGAHSRNGRSQNRGRKSRQQIRDGSTPGDGEGGFTCPPRDASGEQAEACERGGILWLIP